MMISHKTIGPLMQLIEIYDKTSQQDALQLNLRMQEICDSRQVALNSGILPDKGSTCCAELLLTYVILRHCCLKVSL